MRYIIGLKRSRGLRRSRRRVIKEWKARSVPSRRKRRRIRWILAGAAAGELLWIQAGGGICQWFRDQWPHVSYIEEIRPDAAADRAGASSGGAAENRAGASSGGAAEDRAGASSGGAAENRMGASSGQATVKQGFSILLEEKCISIFRVEEAYVEQESCVEQEPRVEQEPCVNREPRAEQEPRE